MNYVENGMNGAGEEYLVFVNTQDCPYQRDARGVVEKNLAWMMTPTMMIVKML